MSAGPFLYDDDPAPLHTGTPRRRQGLLIWLFGGTAAVAVLMVGLSYLIKGSPDEQAREVVGVFVAALDHGDTETAYGLLCESERARVPAADVRDAYAGSRSGSVDSARKTEVDGSPVYEVLVRWSGGGSSELTVVAQDGPRICGVHPAG